MIRRIFLGFVLMITAGFCCFGQAALLRDYVGLINQTFHPDIVSFLEKLKKDFEKNGSVNAAKSLEIYLRGGSGSGFVYVADDGSNYIITNHHVITKSYSLSITFEKQNGEQTKFTGLNIVAANEDMDIAVLAFDGGENPFSQGLVFLDRPVEEGEDVFSAGFPGMGTVTLWQFGRGMVSNASARFPAEDGTDRILGPYIQHTAQVDPGNSGGPLLVPQEGVPSGYAVAGINTLSARYRQAANFSIPLDRLRSFLDANLRKNPDDERLELESRVASFIAGLSAPKAVYPHIAKYLSNACIAENAESAISETMRHAPRSVTGDIIQAFAVSPVDGMNYAVAWTIENSLRSKRGKIEIETAAITAADTGGYTVTFNVNNGTINTKWINEYGIWRINAVGEAAPKETAGGEQNDAAKRTNAGRDKKWTEPDIQFSAGFASVFDRCYGFGGDIKIRVGYVELNGNTELRPGFGTGMRTYIGGPFFQLEMLMDVFLPIELGKFAITPYGDFGLGFQVKAEERGDAKEFPSFFGKAADLGASFQAGLMFSCAALPGFYLQGAYQFNAYFSLITHMTKSDPNIIFFSLGYSF